MPALEKGLRRRLFYTMAVLFAVVTPLALLYSRGYVFDFASRDIVSTGGIFVKAVQPGVRVTIDPDITRETSFLSRGALITSLLPRRYTVRVEKDGYRPWEKTLTVRNEEVLEFRNIFLPPATITPAVAFTAPQNGPGEIFPLAERREALLAISAASGARTLFVVDPETGRSNLNFIGIHAWAWAPKTATFILGRRSSGGTTQWFRFRWIADGREEQIRFRGLPAAFSADAVTPHPAEPEQFYCSAGGSLFLQGNATVPIPIAEALLAYAIGDTRIYYLSKNGFFVESNLLGQDVKILGRKGLFISDEEPARIAIAPSGVVLIRDSSGALFLYEPGEDAELQFVAGNILGFAVAPEGDRMLFWDAAGISMFWLRENREQPFDLARTRQRIIGATEPIIGAAFNENGSHILFATRSGIRMVETDVRGAANSYDLVGSPVDSFALDPKTLAFSWTRGPNLFRARLQ